MQESLINDLEGTSERIPGRIPEGVPGRITDGNFRRNHIRNTSDESQMEHLGESLLEVLEKSEKKFQVTSLDELHEEPQTILLEVFRTESSKKFPEEFSEESPKELLEKFLN